MYIAIAMGREKAKLDMVFVVLFFQKSQRIVLPLFNPIRASTRKQ